MSNQRSVDYNSIGKRVMARRQEEKLTQGELARMVGVSNSFIGHIERAEKIASVETMARLSEALGVSLDYLVFGSRPRCEREACPLFADLQTLLEAYNLGRGR